MLRNRVMPQTKKKKQPKNAFLLFMIHFKSQQEAKGIMFPGGMKDVAAKAEPIWKKMDLSEKWIYEEESRKEKERDKLNLENKYTTFGKSYAQVEREKNEAIEEQIRMTQEIEVTVRSLDCCTSLQTNKFYLIHVNYYCRHEKGMYTPCELALAEFNFVDGIRSVYHTLINPGTIPLGYKYEANKHSEETHQIPVPPEEFGGETDYVKILISVKQFLLGPSQDESLMPPLYTQPNCIDAAKDVLSKLEDSIRAGCSSEFDVFRVYPLPKLFYELRNACVSNRPGKVGFPAFSLAERELDKDVFNYTRGISCEFHEETDALPFCSLSCVRRWGFLIMDHCCKDLGIQLVAGKHCPKEADTSRYLKLAYQASSTAGDASPHSSNSLMKTSFVDYGSLLPDPSSAQHFTLGATPGIVSVSKQPEPKKLTCREPLAPLRPPKTDSVALSLMTEFTEEDFPVLGSSKQSKPAGVMRNEPIAVAGRGKLAAGPSKPVSLGRGRGLVADLEKDFDNMQFS
ncbi:protein maelstrom homolog isoform X2 [Zootermopsis nevadensis]|uniref:protein maelstrom homolog isoform X2 n=1 Tax=Zootermopsis nevadensis TaxID=136037 RepID=UPI000B8ED9E9|nr:protein maelstrom homolog isoform X2 [Zootermopsis nevadensis]